MKHPSSREQRRHSSTLVPYSYYPSLLPDYFTSVPLHWHEEFELNYILQGEGDFICGDERFSVQDGDIILLQPDMLHAVYTHQKKRLAYDTIVFHARMLGFSNHDRCTIEYIQPIVNGSCLVSPHITPRHPDYGQLRPVVEAIFSCAKGDYPHPDLLLKSELMRLFWLLETGDSLHRYQPSCHNRSDSLRPILEYMNDHFTEELTVEQLALRANLSKSYFMNCFKQTAGVSAMEYIIQLRISAACRMLLSPDITVAEAAFSCGFNNLSNFNRHFKRIVGCTPVKYKKSSLR